MNAPVTVVAVTVAVEREGRLVSVEVAAAFDAIRSTGAATAAGRQIGDLVGQNLALRLQRGETLSSGGPA